MIRLRTLVAYAWGTLLILWRPARHVLPWPNPVRLMVLAAGATVLLAVAMIIDAWSIAQCTQIPPDLVAVLKRVTDLGRSGILLWPLGVTIIALAYLTTSAIPGVQRLVFAACVVRLGFVFIAIAVPGLFVAVVKRLIGRARPDVMGDDYGAITFAPFSWNVDYASLPSGHATTAFAALVAIGTICPKARPLMWIYAMVIAFSRVLLVRHYPTDVVAGALVGAGGAWLIQRWFAKRGIGFAVTINGMMRPMPGPRLGRIVRAIAPGSRDGARAAA